MGAGAQWALSAPHPHLVSPRAMHLPPLPVAVKALGLLGHTGPGPQGGPVSVQAGSSVAPALGRLSQGCRDRSRCGPWHTHKRVLAPCAQGPRVPETNTTAFCPCRPALGPLSHQRQAADLRLSRRTQGGLDRWPRLPTPHIQSGMCVMSEIKQRSLRHGPSELASAQGLGLIARPQLCVPPSLPPLQQMFRSSWKPPAA